MATNLLWFDGTNEARALSAEVLTFLNLSNVENTALSTWAGSANLTTVGTIATGTWHGSVIGTLYGGTGNVNGTAAGAFGGSTGILSFTGMAATNRIKTVRDAADTILELGGSYTPTGTWTSLTLVTPVLGTPASGNLANCTFPTLNQNTSGTAAGIAGGAVGNILYQTGPGTTGYVAVGQAGQLLQSAASAIPVYTTATYPGTATGTGTILRANGTNWVATTSTFSDTYATNNLLYSNGANTVVGLATANNGVLVTSGGGVPSISTTLPSGLNVSSLAFSVTASVSAAGSTQGTSTALSADFNVITTVAAGTGVQLPAANPGTKCIVINKGANTLLVYPRSAVAIDSLSANAGFSLPVGAWVEFNCATTSLWYSSSSILVATNANLTGDVTSVGNATTYNNTVPATKGGTGLTTYALGDLIYATGTNTLGKLAGNTVAAVQVLIQQGTGSVSSAPSWQSTTGFGLIACQQQPLIKGLSIGVNAGISAAGSTQSGATAIALNDDYVTVTTVASGTGVKLPDQSTGAYSTTGQTRIIVNKGANALLVYPFLGGSIDALSANTAISVPVNGMMTFWADTSTHWYSTSNLAVATTALTGTITNAQLANSTVTIGSTSVALGATVTTFAGLTSVTSTTFVGALTGNATSATNVAGGATSQIVFQTGAGATGFITTANNGVLITGGTGIPSISSTLPSGLTAASLLATVSATVSAAGSTQGTATALPSDFNDVTTVAASAGVVLPATTVGKSVLVINKGANALTVYPPTSSFIDALSVNVGLSVPVNGVVEFKAVTTTQWYSTFNQVANVSLATGTLAVANGGTGVTTSTGSGNTVLSVSPTFAGTVSAAALTLTGLLTTVLSATGSAGVNIPHGAAPTSPVNGDFWSTTAGFFGRVNGTTVGPFSAGGGSTPTGTGFYHITGGVADGASVAETGTGSVVRATTPSITGALYSTAATITAAGSTQGTATALTNDVNLVTTSASSANGVVLPTAAVGKRVIVMAKGVSQGVVVYPASGASIDSSSANTSVPLGNTGMLEFIGTSTTQWISTSITNINLASMTNGILGVSQGGTGVTGSTGTGNVVLNSGPVISGMSVSNNTGVSAAGTTQGTATLLAQDFNVITTAAASSGVILGTGSISGKRVIVINKGANALAVYPAVGETLDALASNTAISLPTTNVIELLSTGTGWLTTKNLLTVAGTTSNISGGAANQIVFQTGVGATGFITTANNGVLVTSGAGLPSISSTLPTGLTISGLIKSTAATVSAAGTTQGTATALTSDINVVTTVAANAGVVLPTTAAGKLLVVINKGANPLTIYPPTSSAIDALSVNVGISVPVNGWIEFDGISTTQWYSTNNAPANVGLANGTLAVANGGTGVTTSTGTGNVVLSASPTFTGTVGAAAITATGTIQDAIGDVRILPQNLQTTTYNTALNDSGKSIGKNNTTAFTITISANATIAYPLGTVLTFFNANTTASLTIAIGGTDVMNLAGTTTTGSRTLAPWGTATALKVGTTQWIISGAGLT